MKAPTRWFRDNRKRRRGWKAIDSQRDSNVFEADEIESPIEPVIDIPPPLTCVQKFVARYIPFNTSARRKAHRRAAIVACASVSMSLIECNKQMRECKEKIAQAEKEMKKSYENGDHDAAILCLRSVKCWRGQYSVVLQRHSVFQEQALTLQKIEQNNVFGEAMAQVSKSLRALSRTQPVNELRKIDKANDMLDAWKDDNIELSEALNADGMHDVNLLWEELLAECGPPGPPPETATEEIASMPVAPTSKLQLKKREKEMNEESEEPGSVQFI